MYIPHFVHYLFVDRYLGFLCLLAIVKNGADEHGCADIFESLFSIILVIYPGVKLLHHIVILFLIFKEYILFSVLVAPFYISTNNAQGSNFFTSVTSLILIFFFFDGSHPNRC